MPYALLDDQYHSNPKVIAMGLDGAGLYSRALSYCADYLTDGLIPLEWAAAVAGRRSKLPAHLEHVGAWQRVHERDHIVYADRTGRVHELDVKTEGFWIPDYTTFNPSRTEYETTRKRKSKAGQKGAIKRWSDNTSHSTTHNSSYSTSHPQTATTDVENHGETMAAAIAPAIAPATPPTRAPARTPSPKDLTKAVGLREDPARDDPEPSLDPDDPPEGDATYDASGTAWDFNSLHPMLRDI